MKGGETWLKKYYISGDVIADIYNKLQDISSTAGVILNDEGICINKRYAYADVIITTVKDISDKLNNVVDNNELFPIVEVDNNQKKPRRSRNNRHKKLSPSNQRN